MIKKIPDLIQVRDFFVCTQGFQIEYLLPIHKIKQIIMLI